MAVGTQERISASFGADQAAAAGTGVKRGHSAATEGGTAFGAFAPRNMLLTDMPSSTAGQVYAEAALRAVKTCAPFRLPPDKYEGGWKYVDWTFDPREML